MVNKLKTLAAQNLFWDRLIYIAYRVYAVFYSLLFLLCRISPVKENKIVCCNMKGKRYGDNPKYILDEIIRQKLDYEMIWLIKNDVDAKLPDEVRRAAYNPFSLAYHLSTAKIWIGRHYMSIKDFIKTIIPFAVIGVIMYGCVRLTAWFRDGTVSALLIQIAVGAAVYIGLTLLYGIFFNPSLKKLIFFRAPDSR